MTDEYHTEYGLEPPFDHWTPKQHENWEEAGASVWEAIPEVYQFLKDDADVCDAETAREWYIRTYRPKKRNSGLMERDSVVIGDPERYFVKSMGKFGNAWGSIEGMVMSSFGLSSDTKEEVENAAFIVAMARAYSRSGEAGIARLKQSHEKVGALYGF